MSENMDDQGLDLPQEQFEPLLSRSADMDMLETEFTVSAFDIYGDHVFKTCYGDIRKIVDALRDYSQMLETVCVTWKLEGFHKAMYELRAQELRKIADQFQAGIGYDYDATMEKCRKKKGKPQNEDVGGEAMAMGVLKAKQTAEAKARKAAAKNGENRPSPTGADSEEEPLEADI